LHLGRLHLIALLPLDIQNLPSFYIPHGHNLPSLLGLQHANKDIQKMAARLMSCFRQQCILRREGQSHHTKAMHPRWLQRALQHAAVPDAANSL
jgi:hypothetical protein